MRNCRRSQPRLTRCSATRWGFAESLEFKGVRVGSPEQVADAWEGALNTDRPVVYEAITDPEVPPLPPHIRFEQAKMMSQALAKGDPNAMKIIKQSLKDKVQEFTSR